MKKYVTIIATLLLAACSTTTSESNPLVESRSAEELADTLANLIIQKDAITKEKSMVAMINSEISKAKTRAIEAQEQINNGFRGVLITTKEETHGYVLYLDDTLYLSSDFETKPGLSLHAYLTTTVDPRDGKFPDTTAIDLGEIMLPYGAHSLQVPHQKRPELYRTFVLFDKTLKRISAFAQLSQ